MARQRLKMKRLGLPEAGLSDAGMFGCSSTVGLGRVDSRDSLLGANQIQDCFWGGSLGCDGSVGFERCGLGADSSADHRSTDEEGSTSATIGCSWKVCFGSFVRALPGVIYLKHSETGTACSGGSVDGASKGFGGGSSRRCPTIRTSNI
jgi:hypothetical protein